MEKGKFPEKNIILWYDDDGGHRGWQDASIGDTI
jgi:hypothetical protein